MIKEKPGSQKNSGRFILFYILEVLLAAIEQVQKLVFTYDLVDNFFKMK